MSNQSKFTLLKNEDVTPYEMDYSEMAKYANVGDKIRYMSGTVSTISEKVFEQHNGGRFRVLLYTPESQS